MNILTGLHCFSIQFFGPQYRLMPMNKNHEDVRLVLGDEVALRTLEPVTIKLSIVITARYSGRYVPLFMYPLSYADFLP